MTTFTQRCFIFLIITCLVQKSFSQIIGSSVVTSVSVVLGNENKDETLTTTPITDVEDDEAAAMATHPNQKPGGGVLSVIATLKDIVEKEQLKHDQGKSSSHIIHNKRPQLTSSNSAQSSDDSSPLSRLDDDSAEDEDDDDEDEDDDADDDDDEADDFVVVTLAVPTTTTTTTEAPKVTVNVKGDGAENDTATSAEVNEAIQKISGALLTPGKGENNKQIETIVTDVLTSINDARNSTAATTSTSPPSTTTTYQPSTTTTAGTVPTTTTSKKPMRTTTTTRSPPTTRTTSPRPYSTFSTGTVRTPLHPAPARTGLRTTLRPPSTESSIPIMPMKQKTQIPEIGKTTVSRIPGIQTDENMTAELETEEDFFMDDKIGTTTVTHTHREKPKPAKKPTVYQPHKKPQQSQGGSSGSNGSNRPTDFYDDEIFGYDPYQTFLHGVYVPVETEDNRESQSNPNEGYIMQTTTMKTVDDSEMHPHISGFRPSSVNGKPASQIRKPFPSLPDNLHRPRPSHLQYQHGAAEDVDPVSGLLAIKRPAATAAPPTEETFDVDLLATQPRPILSRPVVENFTNHHNEAHHGTGGHGGHGSHGAHGDHGGHGAHGHGGAHGHDAHGHHGDHGHGTSEKRPSFSPAPVGNPGLEATVTSADPEMRSFIDINNRLALRLFSSVTNPVSKSAPSYNNMVLSPFTIISSLAMMFLGARGSTASQLDGLLQLDDMLTFNPHMLYNNITQSFLSQPNTAAALIRLLIADKSKGDVLEFFKTRVQHFYDARVEEADYKFAGHLAQSIINQMTRAQIQRHSYEMLNYSLPLKGPMSLLTSAFFDGQFSGFKDQSVESMDFIHLAALGRRLISVPALAFKDALRAAYDKDLDATAVEVPYSTRDLSLILVMPGRPGEFAIGGVNSLKSRLTLESWHSLMRGFYPRDPFKVVFPKFRHQSNLNLSYTMQRMGLTDMFAPSLAKFKGINGLSDLYIDQNMVHFAEFGTWEKLSDTLTESNNQQNNKNLDLIRILRPHVREHYGNYGEPMSVNDWIFMSRNPSVTGQQGQRTRSNVNTNPRPRSTNTTNIVVNNSYPPSIPHTDSYARIRYSRTQFKDALVSSFNLPSRKMSKIYYFRQEPTHNEEETVLRFERPFVYILRHNPTGMILMTGQYVEPVTEDQ